MTQLPKDLALRLESIFGKSEIEIFKSAIKQKKRPVSFRVNTQKSSCQEIEQALEKASLTYTKLEFPENCYILDTNFSESDLWKLKIYKHGKIYIQSISSQIPVNLFSHNSILNSFSLQEKETTEEKIRILDACAAPGGKTAQLAEKYPDAEIWAFEPSKVRYEKMLYNLEKLGCENIKTIHNAIENIGEYIEPSIQLSPKGRKSELQYFDMILVDAPCSSEGSLLLSNTKFLENWDISHINKNYKRQKRICDSVIPYLKSGGEMIYSTCTLAPEENEAVVHYLLCHYPELSLEKINLENTKEIITKNALKLFGKHPYKNKISENCMRLIPSDYSEGFFMAKLLKNSV